MPDAAPLLSNSACPAQLHADLVAIVGADHVRDDEASLLLFSEDVYEVADTSVIVIVAPATTAELAAVIACASTAGHAIAPRGAGMSYTGSYLPVTAGTVSIDTTRMNQVLNISAEDMTVKVQAGCSWLDLNAALKPLGLRTPFWGPMSGIRSTIGGGLSQLNAMFGAGHYGTSSESMVALTMVMADGRILRTGARGPDGDTPFYRHYGPDLAGLFCGDSGTLGIKAEITMRLIRMPEFEDSASFSFPTGEAMLTTLGEMARAGIASETCGFDPGLTKVRMVRMSLMTDVKTLGAVVAKEKSLVKGMLAAIKVARGGRDFIPVDDYPLHITAEGRCRAAVDADLATARAIARRFGGTEIENSIAKVIRAMPFPQPNSMLGPRGESWVPVHGHVSLSNAPKLFTAIKAYFDEMAPRFDLHGVFTGFLFTSISTNAITVEPVFFWPRGYRPVHATMMEPAHIARLPQLGPDVDGTTLVAEAREHVKALCRSFGAAHFQIGRAYDYRQSRDPAFLEVLDAVKRVVDPRGVFNPGGLGFPQ